MKGIKKTSRRKAGRRTLAEERQVDLKWQKKGSCWQGVGREESSQKAAAKSERIQRSWEEKKTGRRKRLEKADTNKRLEKKAGGRRKRLEKGRYKEAAREESRRQKEGARKGQIQRSGQIRKQLEGSSQKRADIQRSGQIRKQEVEGSGQKRADTKKRLEKKAGGRRKRLEKGRYKEAGK